MTERPSPAPGVVGEQLDGTVVVLRLADGAYYSLNDVGSRIWELCDGATPIEAIVTTIIAEYDGEAEAVEADVLELLAGLRAEGLLANGG